jgi:hypothetical protein
MRFLLTIILLLVTNILYSQDVIIENNGVTIKMSKKIDSLINSKQNKKIESWKVFFFVITRGKNDDLSSDKDLLKSAKNRIIKYHPDLESVIYFDKPYWKLKVGDFETKKEAEDFISSVSKHYKNMSLIPIKE